MVVDDSWRIAIIVNVELSPGLLANTVGAIGVGLGAGLPALAGDTLTDVRQRRFHVSANRPLPILQADAGALAALFAKASTAPNEALIVPFPAFARTIHVFSDYAAIVPQHNLGSEVLDGMGFAGPERWVRSLTGALRLLR